MYRGLVYSNPYSQTLQAKHRRLQIHDSQRVLCARLNFFKPENTELVVPGRIQDIFAIEIECDGATHKELFCAIKQHQGQPLPIPCDMTMSPIFRDFGVYLWCTDLSEHLDVILFDQTLYHSISHPWSNGLIVLKPMNRVSTLTTITDV